MANQRIPTVAIWPEPSGGGGHMTSSMGVFDIATDARFAGGAAGNGVADDQAALASMDAGDHDNFLTLGTYLVGSDLTIEGVSWFARGAIIRPAAGQTVRLMFPPQAGPWQIFDVSLGGTIVLPPTTKALPQWFGAEGDGKRADGSVSNGSAILTSLTAAFTSADVGKRIRIVGAGAAGASLVTNILGYTSATQVTLLAAASTTVAAAIIEYGTDDTTAFQAAYDSGARTMFTPGVEDNRFYLVKQLVHPSFVESLGVGYNSHVRNIEAGFLAANETLLFGNSHPGMLNQITMYPLGDIAADEWTTVFDNPADAANFAAGNIPIVCSTAGMASNGPDRQFFNRVRSVDTVTGDITFERPFPDSITDPQIGILSGTDPATGKLRAMIENASLRMMRYSSAESIWCSRWGGYECTWDSLWVEGMRVLSGNALVHSYVNNIHGVFYERFLEIADAAWGTIFENLKGVYQDEGYSVSNQPIVSIGDNANVRVRKFQVFAPSFEGKCAVQILKTQRSIVEDFEIHANVSTGVLFTNSGVDIDTYDNVVQNFEIHLGGRAERFLYFNDQGGSGEPVRPKVHGKFFGSPSVRAIEINMGRDHDLPKLWTEAGNVLIGAGATRARLISHESGSTTTTYTDNGAGSRVTIRRQSTGTFQGLHAQTHTTNIISTTTDNVAYSKTIPAGTLRAGDVVRIEWVARYDGTTDDKRFRIAVGGTTMFNRVKNPADQGYIEGVTRIYVRDTSDLRISTRYQDETSGDVEVGSLAVDTTVNDVVIQLRAWVDNAADFIRFDQIAVIPQRVMEAAT